jgi:L-fucose isomerase-like protein
MNHAETLRQMLRDYIRLADGIEALRNMRVATIGVNPDAFATTFSNQMELFRLGFSLHTYELLDIWGDVVLGCQLEGEETDYAGPWGNASLGNPIRRDDERVSAARERIGEAGCALPADERKCDLIARYFVWLQSTFQRDRIDAAAMHCWPQVRRFFGIGAPCAFAMLSNFLLDVPVVCEGDVCHAIMAKLAATLSGEPGVILDVNNNGWDPRVFNAFHCSQTPPNWLVDGGRVSDYGSVTGRIAPVPFTGIAAATSADTFHAVVFRGHFLEEHAGSRGSSGWAYVPNFPEVLRAIEETGIHHFVAAKGNVARNVAEALGFRGLVVRDLSREVGSLEEIGAKLPPMDGDEGPCRIYSA